MEFNNYYPAQPGHPPPSMSNQQHSQIQHPTQQTPQGGQAMHSHMPQQNIRQTMAPGPHQQQMQQMQAQQQQQNMGHHQQQIPSQQQQQQHHPQQQQHQNYHQIQAAQHGPPVSHSSSPHAHQQHHNHQSAMPGPLPQQAAVTNQHVHPQSPHHHGGPPMHMQQQPLNQMIRPPMGHSVMNHPQSGMQQPIHHHQQNFFSGGSMPPSNMHHYPQQNQHHQHQHHHHHHPRHHSPMLHQGPHLHHPHIHPAIGRNSPYFPNILQTEYRIIELNKRLQCRPVARHSINPLPYHPDEIVWWDRFVSEFFEDDATLTLRTHEDKPVEYTIGRTLIPRFFKTYFDGGVTDLSIHLRNSKEAFMHPQMITLDCDQAFIITNNIFKHQALALNPGVVVHTEGHLVLDFVTNNFETLSIKSWRFYTKGSREYIDRSIFATMGMPSAYLAEPVTRNGLTKSTISYLKMCMIMEPMQDLMFQHKQTKMDPRSCLRKLLFDRYKYRSGEDNRVVTNKRRKRKPSAAPAISGTATNKKSKANVNSSFNNSGLNNIIMSPGIPPSFSLASQDVMVVGEPSMMGGDFGDDNERLITRLENTQYDPAASLASNTDESMNINTQTTGNDNCINNGTNIEQAHENHIMSPSLMQQPPHQIPANHSPQVQQQTAPSEPQQIDQNSPQIIGQQADQLQQIQQPAEQNLTDHLNLADGQLSHPDLVDQQQQQHQESSDPQQMHQVAAQDVPDSMPHLPLNDQQGHEEILNHDQEALIDENNLPNEEQQEQQSIIFKDEDRNNSIVEDSTNNGSSLMLAVNSVELSENHTNSVNEESNSNSQLPCPTTATPTTNSAMEQQQHPVDNGVA